MTKEQIKLGEARQRALARMIIRAMRSKKKEERHE